MNNNSLTISFFQKFFGFQRSYCVFLLLLLRGLLLCETVCLARLASYLGYKKQASACQRIRRFLKNITFCQEKLALAFVHITGLDQHKKWILVLDRTYWMFGKTHLNFLYMSVSCGPVCIPLFFKLLGPNKKGNSSFEERQNLMDLFIKCFGVERICYLLGDREFIGEEWLNHLKKHKIPFAQRLREKNQKVANSQGVLTKCEELFRGLKVGEERNLGLRKISSKKGTDLKLHVTGTRSIKGDLVIIVYHDLTDPLHAYRNRWCIEICFRTLKSNGFHIEDSHVTQPHRIVCLLNIVSLAYVFSIKLGEMLNTIKPIPIKNHGYLSKGLVRYALDFVKPYLLRSFSPCFSKSYYLKTCEKTPLIPMDFMMLKNNTLCKILKI